jgi:hypothetical protein
MVAGVPLSEVENPTPEGLLWAPSSISYRFDQRTVSAVGAYSMKITLAKLVQLWGFKFVAFSPCRIEHGPACKNIPIIEDMPGPLQGHVSLR